MDRSEEALVWQGRPSHWMNFHIYLLCALTFWLVLPLLYGIWRWLELQCLQYSLTSQRLLIRSGVLVRRTDEIELYRVKDFQVLEPLHERVISLGSVVLHTSDRTTPLLRIRAIKEPHKLRELLREHVESVRLARGVREVDVE